MCVYVVLYLSATTRAVRSKLIQYAVSYVPLYVSVCVCMRVCLSAFLPLLLSCVCVSAFLPLLLSPSLPIYQIPSLSSFIACVCLV